MDNELKEEIVDVKAENPIENKPKKQMAWHRVASLVMIVVLCSIIALTFVSTVATKSYNFEFEAPDYIRIHTSNTSSSADKRVFEKGTAGYDEIMKMYNASFDVKAITALFQGKLGDGVRANEGYRSISKLSGPYLEFCYESVQKFYLNGKEYKANIVSDDSFYTVMIDVNNSTNLTEVVAYFKYLESGKDDYSYVRCSSFAVQSELYNYIENMK